MPAGITLLEILISIGIVMIGLLGVVTLIPLAHFKAAQGVRRDRIAAMAQRAIDEFEVRGFSQLGSDDEPTWVHWEGGQFKGWPFDVEGNISTIETVCIDPNSIAWWLNNRIPGNPTNAFVEDRQSGRAYPFDPRLEYPGPRFPNGLASVTANAWGNANVVFGIRRLCLNAKLWDDGSLPAGLYPFLKENNFEFLNADLPLPKRALEATWARMFSLKDDLSFQQLEDKSVNRAQEFDMFPPPTNPPNPSPPPEFRWLNRLNNGDYSWMATLTPEGMWNVRDRKYENTNRFRLSVIVFDRREFDPLRWNQEIIGRVFEEDLQEIPQGERKTLQTGRSTFNIVVDPMDEFFDGSKGATFSDVQIGQPIALMQRVLVFGNDARGADIAVLKWFQVVGKEESFPNNGPPIYQFTVSGQTWDLPIVQYPNLRRIYSPIFAIYLNRSVGVYERTIEITN